MSLRRLIEVDVKFLNEQHQRAMRFAEMTWIKSGSPTERRALVTLLESIIERCHHEGLEYPPILLKRKKQLERGDWAPRRPAIPSPNVSHHAKIPDDWIKQAEEMWRQGK